MPVFDNKLIALKPLRYRTRRLMAGDDFDATARDAKVFIGLKWAKPYPREVGKLDPPPVAKVEARKPSPAAAVHTDSDLSALRAEYKAKMGKRPFPGWNAETLRAKMNEGG